MANENQLPPVSLVARDFNTIRDALIGHVQTFFGDDQDDFLESNLGIMILEMVAFIGDNISFYIDRSSNEAFLPTAQSRRNVLNLVKLVGFVPRTATPALVPLQALFQAVQAATTTINAGTQVTDPNGTIYEILQNVNIPAGVLDSRAVVVTAEVLITAPGVTTVFSLQLLNLNINKNSIAMTHTVPGPTTHTDGVDDGNGGLSGTNIASGTIDYDTGEIEITYTVAPAVGTDILISYTFEVPITAFEGQSASDTFSSDGTGFQELKLTQTPVLVDPLIRTTLPVPDAAPITVKVDAVVWTRVESFVTAGPTSEVYVLEIDENDNVTIQFGDNIQGKIPPQGIGNVVIDYRIGGGLVGNIAINFIDTSINGTSGGNPVSLTIRNPERGSGGAERQSTAEIKLEAPRFARTNDTGTTEEDFDTLSSTFSDPSAGTVARAKSRLTPVQTIDAEQIVNSQVIASGDGSKLSFDSAANIEDLPFARVPLIFNATDPRITITATVSSSAVVITDDGAGALSGTSVTGAINQTTGEWTLVFTGTAPDVGTNITATYAVQEKQFELPSNNIEIYAWAFDALGNLVQPSTPLKDALKDFLDGKKVLNTSVQVIDGLNITVDYDMTVEFDTQVAQSDTEDLIQSTLEAFFASSVNVEPGDTIKLAAIYDVLFPLRGIISVIIDNITVKQQIGISDGSDIVFRTDEALFSTAAAPGLFIPSGRVPIKKTAGTIKVSKIDTLGVETALGADASFIVVGGDDVAVFDVTGLLDTGSTLNLATGRFQIFLDSTDTANTRYFLEFILDNDTAGQGILDVVVGVFEIAVLGDIVVNSVKIN